MGAHSSRGASNAYIWTPCTAQPSMVAGIPDDSGYPAAEGTVGHTIGQKCFLENKNAYDFIGEKFFERADGVMTEFVVDDEMAESVQVYVTHVLTLAVGHHLNVEHRVDLSRLYRGMFGTVDVWWVVGQTLYVRDFKHGKYSVVEAPGNIQLAYYAIGAYFKAIEAGHVITLIDVGVVQPRFAHVDGPIRNWVLTVDQLNEWAAFLAAKAAESYENPQLVAGPHCKYCRAFACRARALDVINLSTVTHPISELDDAEAERFLAYLGTIRKGFDALHRVFLERMKVGRIKSTEYKLIRSSPRSTCPDPQALYDALPLYGLGVGDFQKKGPAPPVSRTNARKKAGDKFDFIDHYYETPDPGIQLVPITARGTAISPQTGGEALQNAFAGVTIAPQINK
jgi:hypothetical protein